MDNRDIYARLGVRTIINAKGPATRLSGGVMDPQVADAMRAATQACVDMGVLCGRRDLVAAAALHNLDHDIFFEQWTPPPGLLDKHALRGLPQHGIGRACKVGKEQVVGLLVALQRFDEAAVVARCARGAAVLDAIEHALAPDLPGSIERTRAAPSGEPRLLVTLFAQAPLSALELVIALQDGEPSVHVDPSRVSDNAIMIVPAVLTTDDAPIIAQRINAALRR